MEISHRASLTLVAILTLGSTTPGPGPEEPAWPDGWVVPAGEVVTRLSSPGAARPTLLDTRGAGAFLVGHVDGARRVEWTAFSPSERSRRGMLLDDRDRLETRLRELGVSSDRPVVVYGDPTGGWGEDGRIVWMLRTLGHDRAALVDGGYRALREAGAEIARGPDRQGPSGNFRVQRNDAYTVDREEVRDAMAGDGGAVIVDTRSRREFQGATPYGAARGGHVPGAVHLHYRELLAADGTLLPPGEIRARLRSAGITEETEVQAYCTGGVRSGWLVTVLRHLGFDARNYAGSIWDWASGPADRYPLE